MRAAPAGHADSGSRAAGHDVPGRPAGAPSYRVELVRTLRVVLVAGLLSGVVIGVLLRVAMVLLRLASPDAVGLTSDDGFEIGRVKGVDFNALDTEVAVALFLAVPLLSGLVVPAAVELVDDRLDRWPRWLPVLTLLHPVLIPAVLALSAVVAALLPLRRALLDRILASAGPAWAFRAAFLLIPVAAGFALAGDLRAVLG